MYIVVLVSKLDFKKVTPSYECAAHLKKERSFKVETRQENFADVEAIVVQNE